MSSSVASSSRVPTKKGNTIKSWSSDRCPRDGGIDQNIYGDKSP